MGERAVQQLRIFIIEFNKIILICISKFLFVN